MKKRKQRILAMGVLLCMLVPHHALAGKVSYVKTQEDAAYHAQHLGTHDETAVCTCTGNLVKISIAPGSKSIRGRMVQGEQFIILDAYRNWVRIEIVNAASDNPDSRRGITGWIDASYADCGCDETAYYAAREEN